MELEIVTPERKLFSGEVYGVQLPGINGSLEILNRHAPLVAALGTGRIKILKDKTGAGASYNINGGFSEVVNNKGAVLGEGAS